MGRIHVLPEHVANKIAAGEVVERPASVVKELLENALDAGCRRVRIQVEAGGKKLIQVVDDGCGMVRDDAMLAFERHATSKIKNAEDLLSIATLGFRGEALPSIASVSRLRLETAFKKTAEGSASPQTPEAGGTVIEIAGGKILKVEEAGLPAGTSIAVRDLFFNVPARKKFLKAESTELSHIAALVTQYALAHPERHFELHSSTNAMLIAPPVASHGERIYQIFGKETVEQLLPVAAAMKLERSGLPQPPPWAGARAEQGPKEAGELRGFGFVSKPEVQKLNRNSIYVYVNERLIRDRLIQHAITEAYRNILPAGVFPVVLLFLEMPNEEVDVNMHPSKTEVRFRQQSRVHDFVQEAVRAALMKARPVPHFTTEMGARPSAGSALSGLSGLLGLLPRSPISEGARWAEAAAAAPALVADTEFTLRAQAVPPASGSLQFAGAMNIEGNAALSVPRFPPAIAPEDGCAAPLPEMVSKVSGDTAVLGTLKPVGQIRDSFIVAVNQEGLWIIDQHVAHERVLFERVLRQRAAERVESQRLLMPLVIELTPGQQAVFQEISEELRHNGFEAEPFGSRTIAVKTAPAGVEASEVERMLHELLNQFEREEQALNLEIVRSRIAASIACHAAIKVNMPLEQNKMEWLLRELAKTECPMSCPHGRPVVLSYSLKEIQRAFKRI